MSEETTAQLDWQTWLRANGRRLLLCAQQWTNSLADAEDVLQEAFVRYWKHQRHLGGSPEALIITSIRRAAIDQGRSRSRRVHRETQAYEMGERSTMFEFGPDEETQALEAALQKLPPEQREVVVMKIWGGLKFEEIANELNISQNTAASRYRYALEGLRKYIKKQNDGTRNRSL